MISIVVCHRNEVYLTQLKKSIEDTIGLPYEILVINNANRQYSIFEAYNSGVVQSQYPIICFTHEDIVFHTQNWGKRVTEHFKDKTVGMIGVGGGNVFPKSPSAWWSHPLLNDHLINNIQHWKTAYPHTPYQKVISSKTGEIITRQNNNPDEKNLVDAVVLDGSWFCIRKELFDNQKIKFDTHTFKGFHNYDTDISLQVKMHLRVCVVYNILTEHFSQGKIDMDWLESALALNRKWRNKLPIFAREIEKAKYPEYEWETFRIFIYWAQAYGYSRKEINKIISEISSLLPMDEAGKKIHAEILNRVKFGKKVSKILSWMYQ